MNKTLPAVLTALILAFCGLIYAAEVNETAASLFQKGVTAYETGDVAGALKLFRRMQEEFPRSARAVRGWEYIALCENKLGDPYAAFEAYQEIWDNHKEFSKMQVITRNQMRIGNHYMEYKRYSVAEKIFKKILENAPYSEAAPAAQYSLGMAQYNLEKFGEAREAFLAVCQNFPTSQLVDDSSYMLGVVDTAAAVEADYDQASTDQAIASFRDYIREFPTAEHVGEAQQHIRTLRDRKAKSVFDQAYYYDYSGHAKSAIMHYELLIAEYPDTDCAEKAKVRLAALKGEPVLGKKETVTYVDKTDTSDVGPVSSEEEKAKAEEKAGQPIGKEDGGFSQPKAQSAPFGEEQEFKSAETAKENAPFKVEVDPEAKKKSVEETTQALTKAPSSMAKTGEDWTASQSRQTMNAYMQDPQKKEELVTFMKSEYEKEAKSQASSAELLKLYQNENPTAVPPPVEEISASKVIEKQVAAQKTVSAAEEKPLGDTKTGATVSKVESVWAPVPGTEKPAAEVSVKKEAVTTEIAAIETKPESAPIKETVTETVTKTVETVKTVKGSDEWQTVNSAVEVESKEENITSAPPKYSQASKEAIEAAKASGTAYASAVKAEAKAVSAPSFAVVKETAETQTAELKAEAEKAVETQKAELKAETEKAAEAQQEELKALAEKAEAAAEIQQKAATAAAEAKETGESALNAGSVVDSLLPVKKAEEEAVVSTESSVKTLAVTVTTNNGPVLTRSLSKPKYESDKEKIAKLEEEAKAKEEERIENVVNSSTQPASGVVTQDVSIDDVLPGSLKSTDINRDAVIPAPKGTVFRQIPDAGKVSTAVSQAQYQRVVEDKNVKDENSETALINDYKKAYTLVQRAEGYAKRNDNVNARFYYGQALDAFTSIKASAPSNWRYNEILDQRIQKCREELHRID